MIEWFQLGISIVCAIIGGFAGGWAVAYRVGRWREKVEGQVSTLEKRIDEQEEKLEEALPASIIAWRQQTDSRLGVAEARLEKGNGPVAMVPILDTRMEALIEDVREIKQNLRDWMPRFVTKEECDRRHG